MAKKYAPMKGEYPTADDIPAEWWGRMNISREDYAARRAMRLEREKTTPNVGDAAPDFEIERLTNEGARSGETVALSALRGRPTALVFGSYT